MSDVNKIVRQRQLVAESLPERIKTEDLRAYGDKVLLLAMISIEENLTTPDEDPEKWEGVDEKGNPSRNDYFRAQARVDFKRLRSQSDAIALQRIINQREMDERGMGGTVLKIGDKHRITDKELSQGEPGDMAGEE